jgi:DNA-directed RNA polymerase subunit H (RpoH/RPB5)
MNKEIINLPLEWSPVESERLWQQQQFKIMFPNLENDQPDWQRLNFFINAGLKNLRLTNKEDTKTKDTITDFVEGVNKQQIIDKLNQLINDLSLAKKQYPKMWTNDVIKMLGALKEIATK